MASDLVTVFVGLLHVVLGATVVLSTYAVASRGIVLGIIAGLLTGGAIILGDLTVGQRLIEATFPLAKHLTVTAAGGGAFGIVTTAVLFEPGEPRSDQSTDPTTYTNR